MISEKEKDFAPDKIYLKVLDEITDNLLNLSDEEFYKLIEKNKDGKNINILNKLRKR